jgi:hypothetical protein
MKFLSALDAKDRRLMLWCLAIAAVLVVALGFLSTNGGGNDNRLPTTPSSDGTGLCPNSPRLPGPIRW